MKEEFLHYVWKYRLFHAHKLRDNEGLPVEVISPGEYNRDSGPDFFNARLRIGGTEWAGNVEIHIRSSDFIQHRHHEDPSFDSLILHVVLDNDREVHDSRGRKIPAAEISFDDAIYNRYLAMINNPFTVACQEDLPLVERFFLRHTLHSLLIERLLVRNSMIEKILSDTGNDWEETFYRMVSRYFGFRVNTDPFESLASAIPFRIIKKHHDNRFQVESLLFGTAGLLDEGLFRDAINDDYYRNLIREFRILSAKYSLKPLHGWIWKFGRLRPVNFPTVRISQLAGMLSVTGGLFSKVIETKNINELRSCFEVDASDYWNDHYLFGKISKPQKKRTGESATDILLINSVIPVIFCYGHQRHSVELKERALTFLDSLKPEDNIIIREWRRASVDPVSAFETQALLHLRDEYCRKRRCLECRIGSKLISNGAMLKKAEDLSLEP